MKSVQHQYAEVAYESICEIQAMAETQGEAFVIRYGQLCHRFPSLVLTNGLRLAKAFFDGKSQKTNGDPFGLYLKHIGKAVEWDITKPLISDQNNDYLFLSQKVLRASVWFKRYAEAILKVQQGIEIEETSMDSEIVEDKR